jgi:hypothetical protein
MLSVSPCEETLAVSVRMRCPNGIFGCPIPEEISRVSYFYFLQMVYSYHLDCSFASNMGGYDGLHHDFGRG